jgi:protein dithiol oxidoreductase (disulfide-forming)
MKRRDFTLGIGAAWMSGGPVLAAAEPMEGKDFTRLAQPVQVAVPGKVEVIEFFGYWCPHCNAFEPTLDAWVHKLPGDVNFRRIPVAWQAAHEPYQKLYFALEALGLLDAAHRKVFYGVHVQRARLEKDADIAAYLSANGLDGAKVVETMKSFSVASKTRQAAQLVGAYHVDGVPTLAVAGRFVTSPEMAGGEERALQVTDALIRKARSAG